MIDDDDKPLLRLRVTTPEDPASPGRPRQPATIGHRPGAGARTPVGVAVVSARRRAGGADRKVAPKPLVARYSWRVGLVGFALFSTSSKFVHTWMTAPSAGGSFAGVKGGSNTMADGPEMFLTAAVIAALIGLAWLACAVFRMPALKADEKGISGFTLLGARNFAWADIDRIEINWHQFYKRQLIVHAVRGSATGGWGIIQPIQIPVMTAKVDRSIEMILAAIKQYRPDIRVERNENATLVAFSKFVSRLTKLGHDHD